MDKGQQKKPEHPLTRRRFIYSSAAAGTGLAISSTPLNSLASSTKLDDLNIALIGFGAQGRMLFEAIRKMPAGVRFKAICDIWPYKRKSARQQLKWYGFDSNIYVDYQEMLANEKDLDCVIVATPDFAHAEQSNAAMQAGCHVYCEKTMANTIEQARSMIKTQRETGRLLQIGLQRRSNPRYIYTKSKLIDELAICGKITAINGQWNRSMSHDIGASPKISISKKTLNQFGYENMYEFLNWRWFKRYSGGLISDLGAHQIDIFNWFLNAKPKSIQASGLSNNPSHEWPDSVTAILQYETPYSKLQAIYQAHSTTNNGGGYFEHFMGTKGSIKISENPRYSELTPNIMPQPKKKEGYIEIKHLPFWQNQPGLQATLRELNPPLEYALPTNQNLSSPFEMPHPNTLYQKHLENFFNAVRGKTPLHCPAEVAFPTTVIISKVHEAIASKKEMLLRSSDFKI